MNLKEKLSFSVLSFMLLSACSGGSGNSGNGDNARAQGSHYVNWESIPAEFHPSVEEVTFSLGGIEKLNVDVFGFREDVELRYSSDISPEQGLVRVYKVWKKSATWGFWGYQNNGKNLDVSTSGSYHCTIGVANGQIKELEGGCYVRVEIILPVNVEIEVYNSRTLITKRYIPIDNETFLRALDDATWSNDKFTVIENFLASYTGSKKPSLNCYELSKVLREFLRTEEKFSVLRRLHSVISDREKLGPMIESEFSYFERQEARAIVGLN